jgi:hypothetical protein
MLPKTHVILLTVSWLPAQFAAQGFKLSLRKDRRPKDAFLKLITQNVELNLEVYFHAPCCFFFSWSIR